MVMALRMKILLPPIPGVLINEVRPSAVAGQGFVEFHNPLATAVDLQGHYLSSDPVRPQTLPDPRFAGRAGRRIGHHRFRHRRPAGRNTPVHSLPDTARRRQQNGGGLSCGCRWTVGRPAANPPAAASGIVFATPTPGRHQSVDHPARSQSAATQRSPSQWRGPRDVDRSGQSIQFVRQCGRLVSFGFPRPDATGWPSLARWPRAARSA